MMFKRPGILWIVLAAVWLLLALAWFVSREQMMLANVIAIACGYPDAPPKAYAACVAAHSALANSAFWSRLVAQDGPWIVLPPLVLLAIGSLLAERKARRAAA
jgi:hypothetical protein